MIRLGLGLYLKQINDVKTHSRSRHDFRQPGTRITIGIVGWRSLDLVGRIFDMPQENHLESISSTFYEHILHWYFGAKNYKAVFWVWNFLAPKYKQKSPLKMLIKLMPGFVKSQLFTYCMHIKLNLVKYTHGGLVLGSSRYSIMP